MNQISSRKTKPFVLMVVVFVAMMGVIHLCGNQNESYGDAREVTPKQAFKSGGARSEIVLLEISATLKRIDERLQRMEKLAAEQAKTRLEP